VAPGVGRQADARGLLEGRGGRGALLALGSLAGCDPERGGTITCWWRRAVPCPAATWPSRPGSRAVPLRHGAALAAGKAVWAILAVGAVLASVAGCGARAGSVERADAEARAPGAKGGVFGEVAGPPTIIVIPTDDLRADDLNPNTLEHIPSPVWWWRGCPAKRRYSPGHPGDAATNFGPKHTTTEDGEPPSKRTLKGSRV
jgi:hypothetical protein